MVLTGPLEEMGRQADEQERLKEAAWELRQAEERERERLEEEREKEWKAEREKAFEQSRKRSGAHKSLDGGKAQASDDRDVKKCKKGK